VAAVLPQVFEAVADEADDPVTATAATTTKIDATVLSATITFGRPSATAKPM
jgi:hypothetical protein